MLCFPPKELEIYGIGFTRSRRYDLRTHRAPDDIASPTAQIRTSEGSMGDGIYPLVI